MSEFCFNYRHPGPRRVWKRGPVLQPMTPDPGNPGNSRETRIVPNRRFASTKLHVIEKSSQNNCFWTRGKSRWSGVLWGALWEGLEELW